ncbi:MAG: hypothetical protein ONB37_18855 [candidate division KSB1 bacterium]|nr:hypothetical protein [candidate division KSB1 bacterium]
MDDFDFGFAILEIDFEIKFPQMIEQPRIIFQKYMEAISFLGKNKMKNSICCIVFCALAIGIKPSKFVKRRCHSEERSDEESFQ